MTTRNTAILAAVTVLLGIYVAAIERGKQQDLRNFSAVPVAASSEEITGLTIVSGSGEIALEREGDSGWQMTSPVKDRADASKVEELVTMLVDLKKLESMDEGAPSDAAMGLGEGAIKVKIATASGAGGTLTFGDNAGVEEAIYARWEDGAPFVCWQDARDKAALPCDELRDIRLLSIPMEEMRRLKIKDETEASLVVDRETPESPWMITKPFSTPADPAAVKERLSLVANMGAHGFIDNPSADVSAAFASGAITVSVWREGVRGPTEMRLASSADGEEGFATVSGRDATFSIDPAFLKSLSLKTNDVRDRRLVAFNPKSVLGVKIEAKPNHEVNLGQDNTGWSILELGKDPVQASRQRILRMLKELASEEAKEFVADAVPPGGLKKWGLDAPTLTITLATVQQDPDNPTQDDGTPNLVQVPIVIDVKGVQPDDQPAMKFFATVKGSGTVVQLSPAFPPIVPIRKLDFRSLYLWPSFARESLRSITTSRPPQAAVKLEYQFATNQWTGTLAGEDITARIDEAKALELTQELSLPLSAQSWLTKSQEQAIAALARPARSLEFVLEDADGKRFTFGIDAAPVNPDIRSPFFYARPRGSEDICIIDRRTFELLDSALVKDGPVPPAPEPEQ